MAGFSEITPPDKDLLNKSDIGGGEKIILKSLGQLPLPIQQLFFTEDIEGNSGKFAFLVLHGQDKGRDS